MKQQYYAVLILATIVGMATLLCGCASDYQRVVPEYSTTDTVTSENIITTSYEEETTPRLENNETTITATMTENTQVPIETTTVTTSTILSEFNRQEQTFIFIGEEWEIHSEPSSESECPFKPLKYGCWVIGYSGEWNPYYSGWIYIPSENETGFELFTTDLQVQLTTLETTTTTVISETEETTATTTVILETTTIETVETPIAEINPFKINKLNEQILSVESNRRCRIGISVVAQATGEQIFGYKETESFISNCTVKFLIIWCYQELNANWEKSIQYSPNQTNYSTGDNCNLRAGTYTALNLASRSILYSDNRAYECLLRDIGLVNFQNWYYAKFGTVEGEPPNYGFMGYATPYIRSIAWSRFANTTYQVLPQVLKNSFFNANPSDAGLGLHKGGWYSSSRRTGATLSECGITTDGKYAVSIFIQYSGKNFIRSDITELSNYIREFIYV